MLGHTKMPLTDRHKMVEILFSTHHRYAIPLERATDLLTLLENLKYVKKLETSEEEWISLDELMASDVAKYSRPGLALRGARLKENLSQAVLSKRLGIRPENLSKMENGKRTISLAMAKKLAKILNIDYRVFL